MKFKNETEENIKYRLGSYASGFEWYTIRPEETIELPEFIGLTAQLTPVKVKPVKDKDKVKDKVKDEEPMPESEPVSGAGFQEEDPQEYFRSLVSIKGVGKVSARQIMLKYPTEIDLRVAIQEGEEIHKHDGVDEAVKECF